MKTSAVHSVPVSASGNLTADTPGQSNVLDSLLGRRCDFLNFLAARVHDREIAEELLQTAYLRAFERGSQLRNADRVIAWFYRILRNVVADHFRRQLGDEKVMFHRAELPDLAASQPQPGSCQCVPAEVDSLKPEYADALRELEMGDASVVDYAASRGLSVSNASVRLHRARTALRKRAQQICGICAGAGCFACSCEQPSSSSD